ncbi:MAG: ATP-dependent metallopeptidase FtsH/Yme1/Tma family protein [Lachnospiraceae bacterium]
MNEVKTPKKPLIFYYGIALAVLVLFNFLVLPRFIEAQVKEVDYGTFMSMTEKGNIGRVEV